MKIKIKGSADDAAKVLGKGMRNPHQAQSDLDLLNGDGSRGAEMMDENPDSRQAEGSSKSEVSQITKKVKKTLVVPATEATPVQGYETVDTVDRSLPVDSPERARRANNQARDMRCNLGRGKAGIVET